MRAIATGDAGPMLNPSGISLIRSYAVEAGYQYGKSLDSHDARIAAVDSTSAFNLGGALYYAYHRDSPGAGLTETGHLFGGSLSFPFLEKIYLGGNIKYSRLRDAADVAHNGFTFDAGLTVRPLPQLSIAAVGYNLRDLDTPLLPRGFGGGLAVMPIPMFLLVADVVMDKVYDDPEHDLATHFMGGGEFSFSTAAALRAGGGHDGLTKNNYFSVGLSGISPDVGAIDIGLRQDVSGERKVTLIGVSARLFVPSM
jgi:hypothetical protein